MRCICLQRLFSTRHLRRSAHTSMLKHYLQEDEHESSVTTWTSSLFDTTCHGRCHGKYQISSRYTVIDVCTSVVVIVFEIVSWLPLRTKAMSASVARQLTETVLIPLRTSLRLFIRDGVLPACSQTSTELQLARTQNAGRDHVPKFILFAPSALSAAVSSQNSTSP